MPYFITILAITAAAFLVLFLSKKYPNLKNNIWFFRWLADTISTTVVHWQFNSRYSDVSIASANLLALAELSSDASPEAREQRVLSAIKDAYSAFKYDSDQDQEAIRLATIAYKFIASQQDIMNIVNDITTNHKSVDVRKATYLCIDLLGLFVDRKDELGQEYFQHLIYGINKSLVIIRDKGRNKDALKEVVSTLFRVYKLTKAYNFLRSTQDLSKKEFYERVNEMFNRMFNLFI